MTVEPISDRRLAIWRNAAGLPARHVDIPRDEFEALLARLDAAEAERDAARDALSGCGPRPPRPEPRADPEGDER